MFDNNLFMDYDYGDDVSTTLLKILRQGTEIEEMKASEVIRFRNRVRERVEQLTSQLTKNPFFILAYRRDGVVRMTERFERMWKKKEAHWEDDLESSMTDHPKPAKRRRKSKAVRAKAPIVFPNLREQEDMRSQMQLATMAETALELSAGQEEEQESRPEGSFFSDAMVSVTMELERLTANRLCRTCFRIQNPNSFLMFNCQVREVPRLPRVLLLNIEKRKKNRPSPRPHFLRLERMSFQEYTTLAARQWNRVRFWSTSLSILHQLISRTLHFHPKEEWERPNRLRSLLLTRNTWVITNEKLLINYSRRCAIFLSLEGLVHPQARVPVLPNQLQLRPWMIWTPYRHAR
jgi:hypothetical protein